MGNDLNKAFEIDDGLINDGAVVIEALTGQTRSTQVIYTGDLVTQIVYFKSPSRNTTDRLARATISYSGDNVSTAVYDFYDTDGTTVLSTKTVTYTYNGDTVIGAEDT